MKAFLKKVDLFQKVVNNLISAIMMIIMVIILAQTIGRAVHASIPWSEEASRYLFVVMILLGINIGISKGLMVRIDIIDNFLPAAGKKIMEFLREVVGLVVACMFFISTFPMIRIGSFQKSPAMQIPMSVLYSVMAVGFALAVVAVLLRIVKLFVKDEKEEQS